MARLAGWHRFHEFLPRRPLLQVVRVFAVVTLSARGRDGERLKSMSAQPDVAAELH